MRKGGNWRPSERMSPRVFIAGRRDVISLLGGNEFLGPSEGLGHLMALVSWENTFEFRELRRLLAVVEPDVNSATKAR